MQMLRLEVGEGGHYKPRAVLHFNPIEGGHHALAPTKMTITLFKPTRLRSWIIRNVKLAEDDEEE